MFSSNSNFQYFHPHKVQGIYFSRVEVYFQPGGHWPFSIPRLCSLIPLRLFLFRLSECELQCLKRQQYGLVLSFQCHIPPWSRNFLYRNTILILALITTFFIVPIPRLHRTGRNPMSLDTQSEKGNLV